MEKLLLIRHADRVLCFKKDKSLADMVRENFYEDNEKAWNVIQSIRIDGIIHSPRSDKLIICNDDKVLFYKFNINSDDNNRTNQHTFSWKCLQK